MAAQGSNLEPFFLNVLEKLSPMSGTIYVTKDGLDKMKAELTRMNEERMEIADKIEAARELGDLKENAEYHAAKEAQAMLHARKHDLEDKIARSQILDESQMDTSKAFLGATVRVLNQKTKKEMTYTLVSAPEADMAAGKISNQSPVGKALLGKAVDEVAVASLPAGDLKMKILEITR